MINTEASKYIYNDVNNYICDIVKGILTANSADEIINQVESIIAEYSLSTTNKDGFECLKHVYNLGQRNWIILYTLMCHSFNHLYRFNTSHEYNASFGTVRAYFSDRQKYDLKNLKKRSYDCDFYSLRFQDLFKQIDLLESDFIYFDPPYLGSVGNYNDGKRGFEGWTVRHEIDLLTILDMLISKNITFALSNNLKYNNQYLKDWIDSNINNINIHYLHGDYINCNYHKLDRSRDVEILITNYSGVDK